MNSVLSAELYTRRIAPRCPIYISQGASPPGLGWDSALGGKPWVLPTTLINKATPRYTTWGLMNHVPPKKGTHRPGTQLKRSLFPLSGGPTVMVGGVDETKGKPYYIYYT